MQAFTDVMNNIWSVLTIVAGVVTILLVAARFYRPLGESAFGRFFRDHAVLVAFVVSLLATLGSLTYSDIIGYEPCKLCWFQRIFMYPQALIMLVALIRKDQWIKVYGLILSLIGGAIALYHYIGQLGGTPLPCSAIGYSVSCSQRFVLQYGYVTIPMMAFSAFMLIAATMWISMKREKQAGTIEA